MATMKNENNKTKKKKPFLIAGLILLGFVLASALTLGLVGPAILSPAMFIRNVAILMGAGGAGVGLATMVVKGIDRLINGNSKENTNERQRELQRERTQEQELEQEVELEQQNTRSASTTKTSKTVRKPKVAEELFDDVYWRYAFNKEIPVK